MGSTTARGGGEGDLRVPDEGVERRFLDFPSLPIVAGGGLVLVHRPIQRKGLKGCHRARAVWEFSEPLTGPK
jgi:hypothetical protein